MGLHQEILPRLIAACASIHDGCSVVLIGSVARGTERADSDIDVNLLFPGDDWPVGRHPYVAADNRWQLQRKDEIEGIRIDVAWETGQALLQRLTGDDIISCRPFANGRVLHDPCGIAERCLIVAKQWFDDHRDIAARHAADYAAGKAEPLRLRCEQESSK